MISTILTKLSQVTAKLATIPPQLAGSRPDPVAIPSLSSVAQGPPVFSNLLTVGPQLLTVGAKLGSIRLQLLPSRTHIGRAGTFDRRCGLTHRQSRTARFLRQRKRSG